MSYQSIFTSDLFSGTRIIVTGSGSGIGRCIAHELASLGADLLLLGRTKSKLAKVKKEIMEDGGSAQFSTCDIREPSQIEDALVKCESIDALVNCAGGQFPALLSEMSTNGFEAVIRNNLVGTFNVSKAAFDHSLRNRGGSIVNITANEEGGVPLMGHTGAARAAVHNLTQTAALEWAEFNIRVNAVAPGYIASSGFGTYTDERMLRAIEHFPETTPMGRVGTEAEISAMVSFLLSPAAAFITGQVFRVDGGASLNVGSAMLIPDNANESTPFDAFHRSHNKNQFD
tara:strand:- start:49038 stop:49895 length:858 start_codon:yes stop_codon:yes gene_type:complete